MSFLYTFGLTFIRSFKLYFAEKRNTVLLSFCLLLCIFGVSMLALKAEEQSSLPIGICDLDNTELSADFLRKAAANPALNIKNADRNELFDLLGRRRITAVYVIEPGFGEKIEKGEDEALFSVYVPSGDEKCFLISDVLAGDLMDGLLSHKTDRFYRDYDGNDGKYLSYLEERKKDSMFIYEFDISYDKTEGYETDSLSMLYYEIMEIFVFAVASLLLLEILQSVVQSSASLLGIRERAVAKSAAGEILGVFAFSFLVLISVQLVISLIFLIIMENNGILGAYPYIFKNFFRDMLAQILFFMAFYCGRRKISSSEVYRFLGIFLIFIYVGGRVLLITR